MYDGDEAFATMLLTMSLSANREEYAHPLSSQELRRLREQMSKYGASGLSRLMNLDISGLMLKLDVSEEEAFRLYTLLNRSVQLSYTIENLMGRYGIGILAAGCEPALERMSKRMRDCEPPVFYSKGDTALLETPMLAILGISGVKTTNEARAAVESLVVRGIRSGYTILTGGEPGVCLLTANFVLEHGGKLVSVMGGEMVRRIQETPINTMLEQGRALALSAEHPEAMLTVPHAITRNKVMLAMAEASFIINTDGKRGESEAIRNRYCEYVYAWTGCEENRSLINRGATPVSDIPDMNFESLVELWRRDETEQLSIFDML